MINAASCVHILGSGSIGLLVAWHLRQANIPVVLLASSAASAARMRVADGDGGSIKLEYAGLREDLRCLPLWRSVQAPESHTCSVHVDHCQPSSGPVPLESSPRPAGTNSMAPQLISRLIVATKASDTVPALLSACPRLAPSCEVAPLQNGILGVYQQVFNQASLYLPME